MGQLCAPSPRKAAGPGLAPLTAFPAPGPDRHDFVSGHVSAVIFRPGLRGPWYVMGVKGG